MWDLAELAELIDELSEVGLNHNKTEAGSPLSFRSYRSSQKFGTTRTISVSNGLHSHH